MKIHCLNLNRATARRQRVTQQWSDEKGFEVEFFPAFDRREIDAGKPLPFAYDQAAAIARSKRPLTSGEIACAISHAQLLQQALAKGATEILVMEDDMIPFDQVTPKKVAADIATCRQEFPHVSALLMHEPSGDPLVAETRSGIQLLRRAPYGYRFVWLKQKAMQVLAHDLSTLCYPADWLWNLRFAPMKSVAMLATPHCHHPEDQTYIGNDFRLKHRRYES